MSEKKNKSSKSTKKQTGKVKKLTKVLLVLIIFVVIAVFGIGIWHVIRNIDNGVTEGSSIRYYNSWKYTQEESSPFEMRKVGEYFARNTIININQINDNGDGTATANITVDAPNLKELLIERFKQGTSEKYYNNTYDQVLEHIENQLIWDFYFSKNRTKTEIQIDLVKNNDKWQIVRNDEYNTVVTGNAIAAYRELMKVIYEEDLA